MIQEWLANGWRRMLRGPWKKALNVDLIYSFSTIRLFYPIRRKFHLCFVKFIRLNDCFVFNVLTKQNPGSHPEKQSYSESNILWKWIISILAIPFNIVYSLAQKWIRLWKYWKKTGLWVGFIEICNEGLKRNFSNTISIYIHYSDIKETVQFNHFSELICTFENLKRPFLSLILINYFLTARYLLLCARQSCLFYQYTSRWTIFLPA